MRFSTCPATTLAYLQNKPKNIVWKVIAGNRKLSVLEDHDLVFDQKDLDIRRIDKKFSQI